MPSTTQDLGRGKHTELTDKEVAGVINHADGSVTYAKLAEDKVVVAEGRMDDGVTGFYALPGCIPASTTLGTLTANRLYYEPILVVSPITLSKLVMEVTTGAAGQVRMGIYTADKSWQPASLVLDAGTIDTTSAEVKTIGISQTLQPGRYLLAWVSNATPIMRQIRADTPGAGFLTPSGWLYAMYVDFAFAALPDPPTPWDAGAVGTVPFYHYVIVGVSEP